MPLNDEEVEQLAHLLGRMGEHIAEKGVVPYPVFMALWQHTILPGVDLALIRNAAEVPEILLSQRPEGDPYAGLWHIPGARVMPGATAISALRDRVMKRDLGGTLPREPEFLTARDILKGPDGPHHMRMGQEVYRGYLYVLRDDDPEIMETDTLRFFPLGDIPEQFLQHQLPTIWKLQEMFPS